MMDGCNWVGLGLRDFGSLDVRWVSVGRISVDWKLGLV